MQSEADMTESMRQAMSLDGDRTRLESFYDSWAATYDADVADHGYGLPAQMVATLRAAIETSDRFAALASPDARVLDAGCGTGQVGVALAGAGYRIIDGVDLSAEMVEIARATGVYRNLEAGIDLTASPPAHLAASAEIVTIGGVFTLGHLPPAALATAAELAAPGGLLIVSTRRAYQDETGFAAVVDQLEDRGVLSLVVHRPDEPYTMDSTGDYWALTLV